ncbi:MAG: 50S ribosomal protein L32 [Clostridia bacterium]|nr:50S ribosomal protein L32 [Clostridia bacterium]
MAVPKGKVSKQRGNKRFANNYKAAMPTLVECPQCHEMKQAHRVCKKCGYYDGVQVVSDGSEKE